MSPVEIVLLVLGTAGAIAYAAWWYRAREEPVPGRGWAAALRGTALALAWALLLNPPLPLVAERGSRSVVALLDASVSMSRPGPDSVPLWEIAADSARRFDSVWLFGGPTPLRVPSDSVPDAPIFHESRLAPGLRAAAEGGADRAVIFTDGALTDLREVAELVGRLRIQVTVRALGAADPRIGIASVDAPGWIQADDSLRVTAELIASGAAADSVTLELVGDDDRVLASTVVPAPAAGRFRRADLGFRADGSAGLRRYRVRIAGDVPDLERRDDVRPFYVLVAERPAAPVLISLRPDWEPSFLLPNLDRLTDVSARAYLQVGERLIGVREGHEPVATSEVVRAARDAPLLIVHGYGEDAPGWARGLVRDAQRLLLFPAGDGGFPLPGWEVRVGAVAQDEWYIAGDVPESPLAIQLGDIGLLELPPLRRVRDVQGPEAWSPVSVQRGRRGAARPAAVAGRAGPRRWAVATGEGYWRWAFRPGGGRSLYRALWTGLGGWLMEGRVEGGAGIDVVQRVVERGEPLRWIVPAEIDSAVVELSSQAGDTVRRVAAAPGDTLDVGLDPGRYRYTARGYAEGEVRATSSGPVEVEEYSPELLHERAGDLATAVGAPVEPEATAASGRTRRGLATLGWPYLLIIGLLCAEWVLRRFMGLR